MLATRELDYGDYLTTDELILVYRKIRLLEQLQGFRDQCMLVRTVLGTGARVGELAALRLEDCKPDGIWIRYSGEGNETTKTGKIRFVKLMPELLPHYQAYLKWRQGRWPTDTHLFGGVSYKTLGRWWKQILAEAGIDRCLSIHKGRDTYATHEAASGRLGIYALKCQLGHQLNSDTTEKYYLHVPPDYIYSLDGARWRDET